MFELKHLRTLGALRDKGSLAGAAESLSLSQSALSHQLAELEQRLEAPLFVRKSRPIRFTAEGRLLLELADDILPRIEAVRRQLAGDVPAGPIRLAIECHSCIHWLAAPLARLRQAWPGAEPELVPGNLYEPQQALLDGELDLVLTADVQPVDGIHYEPLFDFEMRLVLAPSDPLASQSHILPGDLAGRTLLTYPVAEARLDVLRFFLSPAGIVPGQVRNTDNTLTLVQMVAGGWGVGALPSWVCSEFERQGWVISRPLGDGLWRRLHGGIRAGQRRRPDLCRFLELIRQQAPEGSRPLAP